MVAAAQHADLAVNTSLASLERVVSALGVARRAAGSGRGSGGLAADGAAPYYVPFRESSLTLLLADALRCATSGGIAPRRAADTLTWVVCVRGEAAFVPATQAALRLAAAVRALRGGTPPAAACAAMGTAQTSNTAAAVTGAAGGADAAEATATAGAAPAAPNAMSAPMMASTSTTASPGTDAREQQPAWRRAAWATHLITPAARGGGAELAAEAARQSAALARLRADMRSAAAAVNVAAAAVDAAAMTASAATLEVAASAPPAAEPVEAVPGDGPSVDGGAVASDAVAAAKAAYRAAYDVWSRLRAQAPAATEGVGRARAALLASFTPPHGDDAGVSAGGAPDGVKCTALSSDEGRVFERLAVRATCESLCGLNVPSRCATLDAHRLLPSLVAG